MLTLWVTSHQDLHIAHTTHAHHLRHTFRALIPWGACHPSPGAPARSPCCGESLLTPSVLRTSIAFRHTRFVQLQ